MNVSSLTPFWNPLLGVSAKPSPVGHDTWPPQNAISLTVVFGSAFLISVRLACASLRLNNVSTVPCTSRVGTCGTCPARPAPHAQHAAGRLAITAAVPVGVARDVRTRGQHVVDQR